MKTIIIVINILLLSLILYNLLDKGEKVLENMAGCPDSGAAGTNNRLLDRLYQEVAVLDGETDDLNKKIKAVNDIAEKAEKRQKKFMSDVNNERKSTGKMMDALPMSKPGKRTIKIGSVNTIGDLFNAMPLQGF